MSGLISPGFATTGGLLAPPCRAAGAVRRPGVFHGQRSGLRCLAGPSVGRNGGCATRASGVGRPGLVARRRSARASPAWAAAAAWRLPRAARTEITSCYLPETRASSVAAGPVGGVSRCQTARKRRRSRAGSSSGTLISRRSSSSADTARRLSTAGASPADTADLIAVVEPSSAAGGAGSAHVLGPTTMLPTALRGRRPAGGGGVPAKDESGGAVSVEARGSCAADRRRTSQTASRVPDPCSRTISGVAANVRSGRGCRRLAQGVPAPPPRRVRPRRWCDCEDRRARAGPRRSRGRPLGCAPCP